MNELNIKSSTIEKGLDLVKGFLERAIGPSIDEFGLIHKDNMRFRRAKNQLKIFQQAKEMAEALNINIKQMDLKALFPLLEGIAVEEDETLQDMWTNLFVNYIDSKKNLTINVYPEILKQLSTNEVKILNYMEIRDKLYVESYRKKEEIEFTKEEIANLNRLGLIEEPNFSLYDGGQAIEQLKTDVYLMTEFGWNFLAACS